MESDFALDSLMQENPTKFIQGRQACMQYQRQVVGWCLCPTYYNIHVTWIVVGVGAQSWKWTWWKGRFHAWRACSNSCSLSFPSPPCLEDHGEEKGKMETRDQLIHHKGCTVCSLPLSSLAVICPFGSMTKRPPSQQKQQEKGTEEEEAKRPALTSEVNDMVFSSAFTLLLWWGIS